MLLLTITPTAVRAEPVPSIAGTLVASRVVVTVLLTTVRTAVTFIDICIKTKGCWMLIPI